MVSDDFPPQIAKNLTRRSRRKRTVRSKELDEMISAVTKAAHVARDKGFHVVSPEAIRCVKLLRYMGSLPLTSRLLTKTDAFRSLLFLSNNGNPKIRSEARSIVAQWRTILAHN